MQSACACVREVCRFETLPFEFMEPGVRPFFVT